MSKVYHLRSRAKKKSGEKKILVGLLQVHTDSKKTLVLPIGEVNWVVCKSR